MIFGGIFIRAIFDAISTFIPPEKPKSCICFDGTVFPIISISQEMPTNPDMNLSLYPSVETNQTLRKSLDIVYAVKACCED